jgi:hypothetical protein
MTFVFKSRRGKVAAADAAERAVRNPMALDCDDFVFADAILKAVRAQQTEPKRGALADAPGARVFRQTGRRG